MTNVSVVIVNYNSGRFLELCVNSVCRSDCLLEIIVVDNASTDGSADFLDNLMANDVSLQVIRNEENLGFAVAINRGVGYSKSENILFLNPDCLVFPHTIRLLSGELDADSSAGIVGGLVFNFDGSEQRGCRRREPTLARSLDKTFRRRTFTTELNQVDMTDEPLPEKRIRVDAVSGSFLMIRRTTFSDVGGMDEDFFLHFEDLDLCHRVRDVGWKVMFVPDISIFHFQGGSSKHLSLRVSWEKHRSMWRYQRKHHGRSRWFRGLVFLMVWCHFLLQRTRWMFTRRTKTPTEWAGLPSMTVSAGSGEGNRLVVLGVIDELVGDMIHFGTTIGWSVFACSEKRENAQQIADVHWLHSEYFDKVPERDAPEFNALLIASSLLCRGAIDRMVEKFRVKRIAILQRDGVPNGANSDDPSKLFEAKLSQETFAGDVMKDKMPGGETRLFSLPSSKPARESHVVGAQWDKTIHDCFSWLSE
jgi:GT2 family glycosyltransferase